MAETEEEKRRRISITPDAETYQAIQDVAEKQNRTPANVTETIVKDWRTGNVTIPSPAGKSGDWRNDH